ncbi:Elicitin, partial [Phytophthora megakarya]
LFLHFFIPWVFATRECSSRISYSVKGTLDNDKLFSTCAIDKTGVRTDVRSLFDVLNLPERQILHFCRAPNCIKPIEKLVRSMPTNCVITYQGSARNLSKEISTLYYHCAEIVRAADKVDEDYIYRYFLD